MSDTTEKQTPISEPFDECHPKFQQYVEGILENIKISHDHEVPKKKVFTDFSIEKILSTPKEEKTEVPSVQKRDQFGHLHFMDILCEIRHRRMKRGDSLEEMTNCKMCGSCSFSQSRAVAANYMAQHLFTHVSSAIYSCNICLAYSSSWKPRVQNHMKNAHPFLTKKQSALMIKDHRYELDGILTSLALQCYGDV